MRLYGLIGYPIGHSFSKKYFTEKFEKEGLSDCRYELFPLLSIAELPKLLSDQPELRGLNVTIPHKKTILPFLHELNMPANLPACNCICIHDGRLIGYNTDATAFEKSLLPLLTAGQQKALVLGQGGAAEAVLFVLDKLGIGSSVVSRSIHDAARYTYKDLDEEVISEHSLIINTTPLGMAPDTETFPNLPYHAISTKHVCYDLVYNPSLTMFLKKAKERGARVKNGEEMLVLQAEESWTLWNQE